VAAAAALGHERAPTPGSVRSGSFDRNAMRGVADRHVHEDEMRAMHRCALAGLAWAAACGGTSAPPEPWQGDEGIDVADGSDESDGSDDGGGDDDDMRLDAGTGTPTDGCTYVDLLFVIDNSGSMCDAQQGLADALPGLVDAIFESLPAGTDVHVGLVTTSFSAGGQHQQIGCAAGEGPAVIDAAYVTDMVVPGNGFQGRLYEYDDRTFFAADTNDASARADLEAWFTGAVVSIGCDGGAFEFPAAAAAYALGPDNADANAGFLRDEGAVLGIFVLTNEVDQSPEPLAVYRDAILAAKQGCGGEDCILTAGLLPTDCVPDANPMVWQFLNAFGDAPAWGDVADFAGYGAVVADALADGIVDTCDDIDPAG
jgi:hypothetical protein